jgi:hypothetical protein
MRFRPFLVLAFLIPCFAAANIPSVRIIMPERVTLSPVSFHLEPEIELANSGQVGLPYRIYPNGNRPIWRLPIWAGSISFELVDSSGQKVSPIYIPLHDYFFARKAILGTETPVRLRYAWPLHTKLRPGRYTLKGTTLVEDEHGTRHKIQCTPATFVVTTEIDAPLPDTPTGSGNH